MIQDLTRIAVIGTARATSGVPVDAEHPAEALFSQLSISDPESALLLKAGVHAVFEASARIAQPVSEEIPVAMPETARAPGGRLLGIMQNALAADSKDLLAEMLREMARGNIHIPHELLPAALGVSDVILRELLLPVLGERGRWLSRLNPDWSWVEHGIGVLNQDDQVKLKQVWDEGTIAERCRVLKIWRLANPAEAREKLAATFSQDSADHRTRLVRELETGLSADDEALLEKCLDDRSSNVKQQAAELLSLLPNSALSLRMRERASAMLTSKKEGIVFKKLKVTCNPPESIDKQWERDGILQKPPAGRGKRAFWLESVLPLVPPSHWVRHLGGKPADLIEAVREDNFGPSVLLGWSRAAVRFASSDTQSAEWVQPIWSYWEDVGSRAKGQALSAIIEEMAPLIGVMNPTDAERRVLELLQKQHGTEQSEAVTLLDSLPRPWSAQFSKGYLGLTRAVVQKSSDHYAYRWLTSLHLAAKAMPPRIFAEALMPWDLTAHNPRTSSTQSYAEREMDRFREIIQLRQSFYEEMSV